MPRIRGAIDSEGAIINVSVEAGIVDMADRVARNLLILQPMQTLALIDTGATRTVIHPLVVTYLGLGSSGYARIMTAGLNGPVAARARLYDVRITLGGHSSPRFSVEVAAIAPATQGVLVILGRDLLDECKLLYNGPGRSITLRF